MYKYKYKYKYKCVQMQIHFDKLSREATVKLAALIAAVWKIQMLLTSCPILTPILGPEILPGLW